jgi:hypothetical protein
MGDPFIAAIAQFKQQSRMDPILIVCQFFQNEIGRFRARFDLTTEDNRELIKL